MARAPQPQHVRIQPASLVKASKLNKVKLSGMVAWEAVKLCSKHKMFVDLGRRLTPHSLRGRISPLRTVAMLSSMVLCGLILFGCWIGFNKLVVALSLLSLLALIIPIGADANNEEFEYTMEGDVGLGYLRKGFEWDRIRFVE